MKAVCKRRGDRAKDAPLTFLLPRSLGRASKCCFSLPAIFENSYSVWCSLAEWQKGRAMQFSTVLLGFTSVYGAGNQDEVAYIVNIAVAPQPIVSYPSNSNWQEVFNPTW